MLHIHNGESSANTLKQSPIPGEQFAFRESLLTGPTPAGLAGEGWRELRARHLSESYGIDFAECKLGLQRQDEMLSSLAAYDEVVLWFEHDLFCQLSLIYLLDWCNRRDRGDCKLSLICISEFPGVEDFRGLGQLNAGQLASLFPARQEVTSAELDLASVAWDCYRAADPTAVERLLSADTSALPFLRNALLAHLARFPSLRNGLGHIENCGLALIDQGCTVFADLFSEFGARDSLYGLGDFQFWLALKQMGIAATPLLTFAEGQGVPGPLDATKLRETRVALTAQGKAVLAGDLDFLKLNGMDQWLGGVHLRSDRVWRWDEVNEKLVRS